MDPERYPNEIDPWIVGGAIVAFTVCMSVLLFWSSAFIATLLIAFCSYSLLLGVRTAKIEGWKRHKAGDDPADPGKS